eukprot:116761_1
MNAFAFSTLATIALSQSPHPQCEYYGGPSSKYMLNLTSISGYRLEYQNSPDHKFYYYTPCTNNEFCAQGNAEFYANSVQYTPGANQCDHYLSVDHHDPPTYFFSGASWLFEYSDGELCSATQQPRELHVWMLCDENMPYGAYVYSIDEYETCKYYMTIRSPLACVPSNKHNENCQWKYHNDEQNTSFYLDLSGEKGRFLHGEVSSQGYEMYYSPCQNAIPCSQQTGQIKMMSIVENRATRTCDHYLAEWQDGRVQPWFHDDHWSFHYFLSQKCMDGNQGEETIRWYCDMDAANATVINATFDGDCRWEFNVKSASACPQNEMYHAHHGMELHKLKY